MNGAKATPSPGKKKVISCSIAVLLAMFVLLIVAGQLQQEGNQLHSLLKPVSGYPSHVPLDAVNKESFRTHAHSKSGESVRQKSDGLADVFADLSTEGANVNDHGQAESLLNAFQDSEWWMSTSDENDGSLDGFLMEGAANVDTAQAAPVEGAILTDSEPSNPREGAFNLPAKVVAEDFKSSLMNKNDDSAGLNRLGSKLVYPEKAAVNRNNDQDIHRKGSVYADTEDSPEISEDQRIVNDPATVPIKSQGRYVAQTMDTMIPPRTTKGRRVYYDLCEECCYRYTTIDQGITKALNKTLLEERGCRQRLPDAMIFGVKKGGTTTLKNYLSYHPDIAFTQVELKFFTSWSELGKGLEYYRSEMVYSTPRQISMEKTPAYSHYKHVPGLIKEALPNVKLIIIMRDPVKRAVSDYVHMQVTIKKKCGIYTNATTTQFVTIPPDCELKTSYEIADTFEASVIDSEGKVKATSLLISKGIYVTDIQRYLNYFRPEQILALDGEAFIHDPYPAIKKVEQFLGVRDYFTQDFFYLDAQKGFFCLNKPLPNNCMKSSKGRPHPVVEDEVLQKLRDFYRPYNKALEQLVGLDLYWSS